MVPKYPASGYHTPYEYELDELEWGTRLNGPSKTYSTTQSLVTPRQLEQTAPSTSIQHGAVNLAHTISSPARNKWRVAACCLTFFMNGLNDSAPGALIPYMEAEYKIGYAIVSLIFVANALGFILAAPLVHALQNRLGRSRAYMLAIAFMAVGYVAVVCKPPFPVVVVGFLLLGWGMGTILAMNNVFIVNLVNG